MIGEIDNIAMKKLSSTKWTGESAVGQGVASILPSAAIEVSTGWPQGFREWNHEVSSLNGRPVWCRIQETRLRRVCCCHGGLRLRVRELDEYNGDVDGCAS